MKRVVIDTNVLISFVTSRNCEQQALATPLFEEAAKSRCMIVCPGNVLAEFTYVMNRIYAVPTAEIAAIIKSFIALPGVTVTGDIFYDHLFQIWPDIVAEYGDAVVAVTAKSIKNSVIATFDRKMSAALERQNLPLHVWKQI
jgi:predicted nucleic acid-binding protein